MPERQAAGDAPLAWTGVSDKPSYYKLFFAYVIALFATGIATVALAVLAFEMTGDDSGKVIGNALSLKMLAYVVAAPIAAALTERLQRKSLLIALDLIRAACVLVLPFVAEVWQVYALVFVFALASATFTLVYLTVVPYLLGGFEDYAKSLARSRVASEVESTVSPLLAGLMLLVTSTAGIFFAITGSFLVSALLVKAAKLPQTRVVLRYGVWEKVLRGPRLILATPDLRGLIALDVAVAVATAMVMVNTVVIVQGVFDLDRRATAIAFAIFGAGAIVGALTLPSVLRTVSERAVMLTGALMITAGLMLGVLASKLYVLVALWLVLGLGVSLALTPATFLIRRIARPEDLQTLFAAQFSLSHLCLLVAYPAAGWLGASLGLKPTAALFGLVAGAATLAAVLLRPEQPVRASAEAARSRSSPGRR
jgi:MFS family permease